MSLNNPFESINTNYLLHKCLKTSDLIGEIKQVTLYNEVVAMHRTGNLIYDERKIKGLLMPLRFQLRKFFEKDNLLKHTLELMDVIYNSTKFTNFIQGELWKNKVKLYPGKILIPFFLYIDDFEINNPLGSHSGVHSICNVYYSFPCCKIENSKLENVFLAATFKTRDIHKLGNDKCFENLVLELKYLEETGISINTGDENLQVHFIVGLITGDNLGLNSILNFNKSFSSNFFCRFCKTNKTVTYSQATEDRSLLRNIEYYISDLKQDSPDLTGIKSECLLNKISSFHVVNNYYADIMHDIFEGVCHYNFCHAILYFTQEMKYF